MPNVFQIYQNYPVLAFLLSQSEYWKFWKFFFLKIIYIPCSLISYKNCFNRMNSFGCRPLQSQVKKFLQKKSIFFYFGTLLLLTYQFFFKFLNVTINFRHLSFIWPWFWVKIFNIERIDFLKKVGVIVTGITPILE